MIQLSGKKIAPFAGTLGQVLSSFITEAVKDSSASPNYAYILFEASALTLTFSKDNADAFNAVEEQLTPALNSIIEGNVSDYLGYAF